MAPDTRRELSAVAEVLARAHAHHRRRDEHDADVANAPRVRYSPLTCALDDALDTVRRLLDDAPSA